ncbi:MAG: 3,4-dihydroxy-2-butanone-4-phosphate synthase [Hyphomicrobiales bacterium]|nr:MAG: 3,4-dihydroxy-2-butanone-4-phosphate synthase [Hyphomicrobiales bacterium]
MSDTEYSSYLSSIEEVMEDARNGRMFILVDHEDRENEGDLVVPAQMATPDVINFMAKHGRGLVCLSIEDQRARDLGLNMMERRNDSGLGTAFTTSIEAAEGVTTGISAHDRAHTIAVAIDPSKDHRDIATPGHVFPLIARKGGVLVRAGHTEAAVDIARMAGLLPAGVICEVMNDDGTMARLPDLVKFAQFHNLKVATISDLIAYRRMHEKVIECKVEKKVTSAYGGEFDLKVYVNNAQYAEHIALVKGDVSSGEPVLVRMHAVNVADDLLGLHQDRANIVQDAMTQIGREGRGVVVLIREPRPTTVSESVAGKPVVAHEESSKKLLEYGVGAQILADLGVKEMILLSNSPRPHVVGLEGYGLSIVGRRPLGENT